MVRGDQHRTLGHLRTGALHVEEERDGPARAALSGRMADNKQKVYRDHACVSALEDFLDRAVRRPAG